MTTKYRERLIDEVKKYPVLYDTAHEHHRDNEARDRCWRDISQRLGTNSEVLKREWKILRDSMRQAIQRSKSGATTKSGEPCKKWRFENRMAFLLPHMTFRAKRQVNEHNIIKTDDTEEPSDQESSSRRECEEWEGRGGEWEGRGGEHEALELFFASVCESAKRLPADALRRLKLQVLEALLAAETSASDHGT